MFGVSRYTGKSPIGRLHAGVTPKIRIPTGHPLSRLRSGLPPLLGACFFPSTRHHALQEEAREIALSTSCRNQPKTDSRAAIAVRIFLPLNEGIIQTIEQES